MNIAKITSKGQLTLPIGIRRQMNLATGDKVAFIEKDGGFIMVNANKLTISNSNRVNIGGIEASLNMEGFNVSDESRAYATDRLQNKVSFEKRVAQIKAKYVVK
jgi:AbrB family looped-hinge helix DNA binding protein